jgi:putative membrane protein
MTVRWIVAALHLLALGIGLGAVWARGQAFHGSLDSAGLRRTFAADTWWGVAAVIWITTGLARAFGGLEKGTVYYLHNHVFWAKMTLLLVILVLEVIPMLTLIRWRLVVGRGEHPDTGTAARLATISYVQAVLVVLMILAATALARGFGAAGTVSTV